MATLHRPVQLNNPSQASHPVSISGRTLLIVALLGALLFHGGLSLYGTYQNTYDAFVHIFFADHWTRSWFDPWEPRWYTGFTLVSYPPLSQQSVALVSLITGDLRTAFAAVQTSAMLVMTLGMYRFARLWVSDEAAGWAAIWLVFSSAMAETVHVFGQLPTTFSLGLLLNALPFTFRWIHRGRPGDLAKSWALTAATTGAHHVTTLFGSVFITAPVIVLALLVRFRTALADEPPAHPRYVTAQNWRALVARRLRRIAGPVTRAGVFTVGTVALLVIVVLPYWIWSVSDPISQVPIPHASRDNFLINRSAGLVFWLIPYGMLLFLFPYVFVRGTFSKAWPMTASIALLAFLGTGGTTPFPKMLLGGAFDILTLDRFTLWASILMLPLAGAFVESLRIGAVGAWIRDQFGQITWQSVQGFFAVGLLIAAIFTVSLTQFRRFQPDPIDVQPLLTFLEKDQHWRWRYLTLGFGDQMAWLSANTTANQVDGNYHSARRLPELTTTPVERLEGAKFRGVPGIGSLQQFLAVPGKYNLKYVFSNDQFYDPLLYFYGWHRIQRLENGIVVWERADVPVLPEVLPRREIPIYQRLMFGILPMLALFTAVLVTTAQVWRLPLVLLAELLGLRMPRLRPPETQLQRIWQRLDRRLLAAASNLSGETTVGPPWQIWLHERVQALRLRARPASARAKHVRALALGLSLLILIGVGLTVWYSQRTSPQQIIVDYYDDLDFRRFQDAYARLNPETRPDFEQYMLERSVGGGLVASYAKLEELSVDFVIDGASHRIATHGIATVQARYITALSYYTDTTTLEMTRLPGTGWTIEPTPADVRVPPDQFLRQTQVDYLSMGRRRVTSATTDFADVLDRPELAVLSADLVISASGTYHLVGEVMNVDVDPADVTLTGQIYDNQGELLTWYSPGAATIHKLRPMEIVPFRIDFEGVAGAALSDLTGSEEAETISFDPDAVWSYAAPEGTGLGSFALYAKAVVTAQDLDRNLGVQGINLAWDNSGPVLSGELINSGLREAVIPHILVTLYDEAGRVQWVDHAFLPSSVRPQRTEPFEIPLTPPDAVASLGLPGEAYANILNAPMMPDGVRADFLPLPPSLAKSGYAYARFSVHAFPGGME